MHPTARQLIDSLELQPLEPEGGWFRREWTSDGRIAAENLPPAYGGERLQGTAIYFLITTANYSRLHRVPGTEVFHHYLGDPVELILLQAHGVIERRRLGSDVVAGERPQCVVPGGVWQGCRPIGPDGFALLGTSMAPGFDDRDFQLAGRADVGDWLDAEPSLVNTYLGPA